MDLMKFICGLLLTSIGLSGCSPKPPTDEEMIARFNANRSIFESLVKTMCRDGFQTVSMDPQWSRPEHIAPQIKHRYFDQFKIIGVKQMQSYDGCRAQFLVWSVGYIDVGDYKNYQFRPPKVDNERASLDDLSFSNRRAQFFYRKIAKDWYIEYAHWR